MISVKKAYDIILSHKVSYGSETIPLRDSIGRVLASDICAERPYPPYNRVCMDGIAIKYDQAFIEKNKSYKVQGVAQAGSAQKVHNDVGACIEVMTGAVLPEGTDTVVKIEDIEIKNGEAWIKKPITPFQHIHKKAKDVNKNDIILKAGKTIQAPDINILASNGNEFLIVNRLPRIAIISTGNELIPISSIPLPHQIRRSNAHFIFHALEHYKIKAKLYHLDDDKKILTEEIRKIMNDHDVLLVTGGVSMGKFDFLPDVFTELCVEKVFHKVAQRPGKPFYFGTLGEKRVFSFPGNPVSTVCCFSHYFLPWLKVSTQYGSHSNITAVLEEDLIFTPLQVVPYMAHSL